VPLQCRKDKTQAYFKIVTEACRDLQLECLIVVVAENLLSQSWQWQQFHDWVRAGRF